MLLMKTARTRAASLVLLGTMLAALVSGCATTAPVARSAAGDTSKVAMPRLFHEAIDISGRLALRYDTNGSPQALDGKFTWAQTGELTHITLLTPFGQTPKFH